MLALGSVQEVIERQIKAGKVEFDIPGKAFFLFFFIAVNIFYRIRQQYNYLIAGRILIQKYGCEKICAIANFRLSKC